MAGFHAYHPFDVPEGAAELTLSPQESSHFVRSLRARAGDALDAFDGAGHRWLGEIAVADARALVLRIRETCRAAPPAPALALAQALPKAGLFDDIVRAAVEIGASEIFPIITERCETRLDAERAASRLARWNTIAVEACKQSGNLFLPRIAAPCEFGKWLSGLGDCRRFVGSLEDGSVPLASFFKGAKFCDGALPATLPATLLFAIGPEGDFSPAEYAALRSAGFTAVRFGANVLRVPTAAAYAITALDLLRQA